MDIKPLVSITVITYNSSKFVIETLDSIKNQSYKNIELIVSDDCSKDNTVEIVQNWLKIHKNQFVNIQFITSPENTGIPANINRALAFSSGEWIKPIAGDDALIEDCIESFINFINSDKNISLVHSECESYNNFLSKENFKGISQQHKKLFCDNDITANKQYNLLLHKSGLVLAPTVFIKKSLLDKVGGYDESLKLMEDTPMWLKLTRSNNKFYFLNKATIKYRRYLDSVQRSGLPYLSERYAKELLLFSTKYKKHVVSNYKYYKNQTGLLLIIYFNRLGLNNSSAISRIIFKSLNKLRF